MAPTPQSRRLVATKGSESPASAYNAPSPGAAFVQETRHHFMPHISFFGMVDNWQGIDHFWSEKIAALFLYLQRYAMIVMWNVGWPQLYRRYSKYYFVFLLDFSAAPEGESSLGKGSMFEGCGSACRIVWPIFCIPILLTWAGIGLFQGKALYYTRNIERFLWGVMRLGLLPFLSMLVRYYILNQSGSIVGNDSQWSTPTSELGVVFLVTTLGLFVYLGLKRSHRQVLFRSKVRHESYLRTRELEYRLRLSATYRNERVWMIASYVFEAWFWGVARGVVDIVMLFLINFLPVKIGVILGDIVLFLYFAYGFIFDIYRCPSTNYTEHVFNCILFVHSILATIQAYQVTSTWLIDTQLDYFLLSVGVLPVGVVLLMWIYFFVDSHRLVGLSVAERRANAKWKKIFGTAGGKYVKLNEVKLRTLSDAELDQSRTLRSARVPRASFLIGNETPSSSGPISAPPENQLLELDNDHQVLLAKMQREKDLNLDGSMTATVNGDSDSNLNSTTLRRRKGKGVKKLIVAVRAGNEGDESFYIPRSGGFLSIDNSSSHVWPVNDGIINELLRLNQENHLIDMLRAARSMLDRISSLHNTAMLIPLDELKTHIFRLQQCVEYCIQYRITHHNSLIHPLQAIFEDLIEQFTYELRVFSAVSITVGHNAKKMLTVSRELRIKQVQRDHVMALVSPLMRRILIKLLALRLFMQLLVKNERRALLGRALDDDEEVDDFGRRRSLLPGEEHTGDTSSDDDDIVKQKKPLINKKAMDEQWSSPFGERKKSVPEEDDPFADPEEVDPFADLPGENGNAYDFSEANLFQDEFSGLHDDEDEERENQLAAMLALEAKKLIKRE